MTAPLPPVRHLARTRRLRLHESRGVWKKRIRIAVRDPLETARTIKRYVASPRIVGSLAGRTTHGSGSEGPLDIRLVEVTAVNPTPSPDLAPPRIETSKLRLLAGIRWRMTNAR